MIAEHQGMLLNPTYQSMLPMADAKHASSQPILVVEDNDDDYDMSAESLGSVISPQRIRRAVNGDACLEFLFNSEKSVDPILILLDLHTYGTDGRDVLRELRKSARYKSIPVVILTSSRNACDVVFCYSLACNAYHVKPLDGREFRSLVRAIGDYWLRKSVLPTEGVSLAS